MTSTIVLNLAAEADPESFSYLLGRIIGALIFPIAGLVCIIVGIVRMSGAGKQTSPYPGYPPASGWPAQGPLGQPYQGNYPGQPPYANAPGQTTPGYPQQMAGGYPQVPPKRSKPGKALIIVGTVLLVFGLLGLLGQAAKAVSNAEMAHVTEVAAVQVLW